MGSTNLQMVYLAGSHVKQANTTRPGTSQWQWHRRRQTKTSLGANVAGSSVEKIHQPRVFMYTFNSSKTRPWNTQVYSENIHNTGQENFKYMAEIN